MRALLLDIGNSRTKAAIHDSQKLIDLTSFDKNQYESILQYAKEFRAEACCFCNVGDLDERFVEKLQAAFPLCHQVSPMSRLPFQHEKGAIYATMGSDRIAALAGAYIRFPNQATLLVDAGSAITYDFLDDKGFYKGGLITAGLRMRLKALHEFTAKLPLVDIPDSRSSELLTTDTQQALQAGCVAGLKGEYQYIANYLTTRYSSFQTLLTGGDAQSLAKFYLCRNFIPNLVLEGLYGLLQCNC